MGTVIPFLNATDANDPAATPHILIVEDDPVQSEILSRSAERSGYSVSVANSFANAVSHLRRRKFTCVTLDLMLDDGAGGLSVIYEMAKARNDTPVILISGTDSHLRKAARSAAKALDVRVSQSFRKPVNLTALRHALGEIVAPHPSMNELGHG